MTTDKLSGIIAGALGIQLFDSFRSFASSLIVTENYDLSALSYTFGPMLLHIVLKVFLITVFLRQNQRRWQHILAIVVFSFNLLFGASQIVLSLATSSSDKFAKIGPTMIANGAMDTIIAGVLVAGVVFLMKKRG